MKLVIRADDVGYTEVCNIGAFETIENGVVTTADVMLDCPGTEDALQRLRNYPWISVGWHAHFWGAPVCDPAEVPSLYDPIRKGFRKNLFGLEDVVYEEALKECRAQLDRCVRILGKAPDVGGYFDEDMPMIKAMAKVTEEYGIKTKYFTMPAFNGMPAEEWDGRKVISAPFSAYKDLETDSITEIEKYDPIRFYLDDEMDTLKQPDSATVMHVWHPGYVDYFVYRLGDYGPNANRFITARTVDVHALCSSEVRGWIREHKLELVNLRDAIYGTNEYQNHLRSIGSDLYMGR